MGLKNTPTPIPNMKHVYSLQSTERWDKDPGNPPTVVVAHVKVLAAVVYTGDGAQKLGPRQPPVTQHPGTCGGS